MLHTQLPRPMPHAVHSDISDFSLFPCSKKAQQSSLSEARLRAAFDGLAPSIQTIADQSTRPPHPLEMTNFVKGNSLGTTHQYNLRRPGIDGGYNSRHEYSSQFNANGTPSTNGTQNSTRTSSASSNTLRPPMARQASDYSERRKSPSDSVAPGLQIPPMVNTPQGSMPQLAAEITCLFWFEGSGLLRRIEDMTSPPPTVSPLASDAIPSTGFRKWVATILSTTQVTQNVILLALLFIYRLKRVNPTVKGKPGSEYRLLTVALMLGNKFLDDNTYTNKTWAEVSGISVQEVHVMEVEFLSNMRYSLYTSDADWKRWQVKLGKFGTYYDRALRVLESPPRHPSGYLSSPMNMAPTLPSPPVSNHASPPYAAANYSPTHLTRTNTPLLLPQITSATVSPIGPLPELDARANGRKRSYDDQAQEPPAKRAARSFPTQLPSFPSSTPRPVSSNQTSSGQRLQLPSLSMSALHNSSAPQLTAPLPPPGGRAMSLVYPPPVQWTQPSSTPSIPAMQATSQTQANGTYGDRSRQLSPLHSIPGSAASSPMSATYVSSSHPQPHSRLSPSYYLQQRSSPYRPVRQVQTLLVPPPSASMHNPAKQISHEQMQYQPLGRPFNERRTGQLPYIHQNWGTPHSHSSWNELPPLPQPIFHR